jgi:hypothetical protein
MRAFRLTIVVVLVSFVLPATAHGAVLVGSQGVAPWGDSAPAGTAEAWQYTAAQSGIVQSVHLYGNVHETTSPVLVGIYADAGNHPGGLLAEGVIPTPAENAWNTASVTPVIVTGGAKYWLAALATGGTLTVRDYQTGHEPTEESSSHALPALPTAWASGRMWANSPASFYASSTNSLEEVGGTEPGEEPTEGSGIGSPGEERSAQEKAEREAREHGEQVALESRDAEERAVREREEEAARKQEERAAREHEEQAAIEKAEREIHESEERVRERKREREERVAKRKAEREARENEKRVTRETREAEERAARESEERATKERAEREAQEGEERATREREEKAAKEKAEEKAAKEKAEEQAAKEKAEEQAAKEKAEREDREAEERRESEAEAREEEQATNGSCTTTVSPGAVTVKPGVTCLRAGSYPAMTISGISGATVRPAPGAKVAVAGIEINASNTTVTGLTLTKTVRVRGGEHNSLIHDEWVGGPESESGVIVWGNTEAGEPRYTNIEYDRFSHLNNEPGGSTMDGQCGTFIGYWEHVTFSHNVCGPENSGHYTQDGGGSYITEEYNTFLGPSERYKTKTSSDTTGYHTNVFQAFHPGEHIYFRNNVVRNTGTNGNTILMEATSETAPVYNDVRFENNLFERDADGQGPGFCPMSNFTYRHNTEIVSIPEGNFGGTVFSARTATGNSDCAEGHNDEIVENLSVEVPCTTTPPQFETGGGTTPTRISPCAGHSPSLLSYNGGSGGGGNFCASGCVFDYNATSDGSANQAGSTHYVTGLGQAWATLFAGVLPGPFGLESSAWQLTLPLPFPAGYQGGGGAPANVGP